MEKINRKSVQTQYSISAPDNLKDLKLNFEAFNILMGDFELSGVFSDTLIKHVYLLAWKALEIRIAVYNEKITKEKGFEKAHYGLKEFQRLLNTYSIFSQDFKTTSLYLFHTLSFQFNK